MKPKNRQAINLIFITLITHTQFLQAHNSLNGGCKNHCEKSFLQNKLEKKLNNINNVNQIKDINSCLNKSLCRG